MTEVPTQLRDSSAGGNPLWTPSTTRVNSSNMFSFMRKLNEKHELHLDNYAMLHRWSIEHRDLFWREVWDFCDIRGEKGNRILVDDRMPGAQFFPDAKLNFAENLLSCDGAAPALFFNNEGQLSKPTSWTELRDQVARFASVLREWGVVSGDRVAAFMPNCPETVVAMLATASLGAVFSSCSPDFGVRGVLDRFGQIEPKILIACDGYRYAGKTLLSEEKLNDIIKGLPSVEHVVIVDFIGEELSHLPKASAWTELLAKASRAPLQFERLAFDHPLYIMFSSGTTGTPKCIVHSAGGTLLQHVKEHVLHCDLKAGQRLFYFSTCGWMMWNWLVSGLASKVSLALYDGSPFASTNVLFDYADAIKVDVFGTSAKYIDTLKKSGAKPRETHDLSSIQTILSTGSPLAPESFDFIYRDVKEDVALCSVSGGTDILGCFVGGTPMQPIYRGEIQAPMLGMAIEVWNENASPVVEEKGELVCTAAFPSMPISFWNDAGGRKYHASYFERFPGVWCHGDFAEITSHGGFIIHGRSDATLNPGGVRIGTAEIYAQVERLSEIREGLAVGQEWDGDTRIILFVILNSGCILDDPLKKRITDAIRTGASPRHVPAKIIAVEDIPRTKSGKITELAVRNIIHGLPVTNVEALANSESLSLFENISELKL